jgi:hypothetical protein
VNITASSISRLLPRKTQERPLATPDSVKRRSMKASGARRSSRRGLEVLCRGRAGYVNTRLSHRDGGVMIPLILADWTEQMVPAIRLLHDPRYTGTPMQSAAVHSVSTSDKG